MRIALTGANGKLGSVVEEELTAAGHDVIALDIVGARREGFTRIDLTDYGSVADALAGIDERHRGLDGVVHLGAVPAPGLETDVATFHNNMLGTFHVMQAARRAGIRRIVTASSETVLGLPFDVPPPYAPVDEEYDTRPESMYSLTKHLEEELGRKLVRWDPQLSITALRFSNVMVPDDYAGFEAFQSDPASRKWNLWGYIDARDGAQAIDLALRGAAPGFDRFIIAAADTVMERSSASLMQEFFPEVAVRRSLGEHETLLSIDRARAVLGYDPKHSWRD
ncbi:NAD(P)-dependent oxidoreductase [Homoserinibacter sp. GY 40078]|uniref:NAD-dependent epimerase/dehydratase family protein n=1 Tax=Homoserinibacter sp. GY 40078 TaxID=2603275 RepID=UPI0011C79E79|nr:NAD(P)-dependent oxidoreductase [Homoserinibacter sp. GY 40078]TXK18652.1 NAD(P)-dependent oxidoreductase [Homoserinibacter sp. GY 40078]